MNPVLLVLAIAASGIFIGGSFALGVWFGFWWLHKHPEKQVQVVEVPKPFVVEKVKEVVTPGFAYPRPGTPDTRREQEDRKVQELINDPEI